MKIYFLFIFLISITIRSQTFDFDKSILIESGINPKNISITLVNSQDMSYAMYFNAYSAVIRDNNKQIIHFFKITNEYSPHSPYTFHYQYSIYI